MVRFLRWWPLIPGLFRCRSRKMLGLGSAKCSRSGRRVNSTWNRIRTNPCRIAEHQRSRIRTCRNQPQRPSSSNQVEFLSQISCRTYHLAKVLSKQSRDWAHSTTEGKSLATRKTLGSLWWILSTELRLPIKQPAQQRRATYCQNHDLNLGTRNLRLRRNSCISRK